MNDLIWNIHTVANAWTGNIQNEMDARYVEKSSLTNLFNENKFLGWAGLISIFVAISAIFYFQFQTWEQEDQEQIAKNTSANSVSAQERLKELKNMFDQQLISEEEYDLLRKKALDL